MLLARTARHGGALPNALGLAPRRPEAARLKRQRPRGRGRGWAWRKAGAARGSASTEAVLDRLDAGEDLRITAEDAPFDLAHRAHDRRVVLAAEAVAQLGVAGVQPLAAHVHRDHPRLRDRAVAPVR